MSLIKFEKFIKQIFTDKRAVFLNLGTIEKGKDGLWNYIPNDLGKWLLFAPTKFRSLQDASDFLEKPYRKGKSHEKR